MTHESITWDFTAGVDLSAYQFQFVMLNAVLDARGIGQAIPLGGSGAAFVAQSVGVLQNTPAAGQNAEVVIAGVSWMVAAGAAGITSGVALAPFGASPFGRVAPAAGSFSIAVAMSAAPAGSLVLGLLSKARVT